MKDPPHTFTFNLPNLPLRIGRPVFVLELRYYHQQYLSDAKNPNGYCGLGGTVVACPVGIAQADG